MPSIALAEGASIHSIVDDYLPFAIAAGTGSVRWNRSFQFGDRIAEMCR